MKYKALAIAVLFGMLLPLLMFLIAENWRGPTHKPQEPTTVETTINETLPEKTDSQQ